LNSVSAIASFPGKLHRSPEQAEIQYYWRICLYSDAPFRCGYRIPGSKESNKYCFLKRPNIVVCRLWAVLISRTMMETDCRTEVPWNYPWIFTSGSSWWYMDLKNIWI